MDKEIYNFINILNNYLSYSEENYNKMPSYLHNVVKNNLHFFKKECMLLTKKQSEIVIAQLNGNLEYVEPYKHLCRLYKIDTLLHTDNVGGIAYIYLQHIINNYENLANITLFTHDNFSKTYKPFPIELYLLPKKFTFFFSNLWSKGFENNQMLESKYYKWWDEYIRKDIPNLNNILWSKGSIFSISKELILQNPLSYYKYLAEFLENDTNSVKNALFFEKSWYYIFDKGEGHDLKLVKKYT